MARSDSAWNVELVLSYGPSRRGLVRHVSAMSVEFCHETKLVQARGRINAGGLGSRLAGVG
jgi:hypothetical protein